MRQLVYRDDYCRIRLMTQAALGAVATGITIVLMSATGLRTYLGVLMIVTLLAGLYTLGLLSWAVLNERVRRLRRLIDFGIRIPATLVDTEWSDDDESPWGESLWTYSYGGASFQLRTLEHLSAQVPTEASALVDPDQPADAVLVMPNGMTRGGWVGDRWSARRVVLILVFTATWVLWVVVVGVGLAVAGR